MPIATTTSISNYAMKKEQIYCHISSSLPCDDDNFLQHYKEGIKILEEWILSITDWLSFEDWWEVLKRFSDWMIPFGGRKSLLPIANSIETLIARSLILQVIIMSFNEVEDDKISMIDNTLYGIRSPLHGIMCRRSYISFLLRKEGKIPINSFLNEFVSINRLCYIDQSFAPMLAYPLMAINKEFPHSLINSIAIPMILCHAIATHSITLQKAIFAMIFDIFPIDQFESLAYFPLVIDALSLINNHELTDLFYPLLFKSLNDGTIAIDSNLLSLISSAIKDGKIHNPYDILIYLLNISPSPSPLITEEVFSLAHLSITDAYQMNRLVDRIISSKSSSMIGPSFISFLSKIEFSSRFPRALILLERESPFEVELSLMIQIELFPHLNDVLKLSEMIETLFTFIPSSPIYLESCGPISSLFWLKKYFSSSYVSIVKNKILTNNYISHISMELFSTTSTSSSSSTAESPFLLPFVFPNGKYLFLAYLLKEHLLEDSSLFMEIIYIFEDICSSNKEQCFVFNIISSSILLIEDDSFDTMMQRISKYPKRLLTLPNDDIFSKIFKDILRKSSSSKTLLSWWKNIRVFDDIIYEIVLWFKLGNGEGEGEGDDFKELSLLVLQELQKMFLNSAFKHKDLFERWNSIEGVPKIFLLSIDDDGDDDGDDDPWN